MLLGSEARYCVDFAEEIGNRTASMGSNAKVSPSGAAGFAVKAIYDYTAADKDEVGGHCCEYMQFSSH